MAKLLWVVFWFGVGALLPVAAAQSGGHPAAQPGGQPGRILAAARSVLVSATGTVYGLPDRAAFDAGVSAVGEDVAAVTARVSGGVASLLEALSTAGVSEEDVRTVGFSIFPEQRYDDRGRPTGLRYRVVNTVRVTVREVGQLGTLLGVSVAAGANEVANVVYTVADRATLERQARARAMAAARAKAEQLARLGGAKLGEARRIVEPTGSGGSVPVGAVRLESLAADAAANVPVASSQLEVTVSVGVTYGLE